MSSPPASDITVDARGLACPRPVIELAKAVRGAPAGTVATVICTDAAARLDVPAWARLTGNEFVGESSIGESSIKERQRPQTQTDGGAFALTVRIA